MRGFIRVISDMQNKKIAVGFIDWENKIYINHIVITNTFLSLFGKYVDIRRLTIKTKEGFPDALIEICKHDLDYLYVDSFNFLLESFLVREKNNLDIPFIVKLNTIIPWLHNLIFITPLIRACDIIYVPTEYAKKSFCRISDKIKVHVIPNSLDIASIRKNITIKKRRKNGIITYMGRLVEGKGVEVLIRSMPEVLERVKNAHLNIIGPLSGEGTKDYPKSKFVTSLKKLVKKTGLTEKVHFKGVRYDSDKYRILAESSVFVNLTTAREETACFANLESLLCGVPVITTDWAANRELIKNNKNGLLINIRPEREISGPD